MCSLTEAEGTKHPPIGPQRFELDGPSLDFQAFFEATPIPLLVIRPPEWIIVAANRARLEVTGTTLDGTLGRRLFDAFPDDPDDPNADGVRNLETSLRRVVASGAEDVMAVQRYAVRDGQGRFVERWWSPINTPVLDSAGEVEAVIHRVEDVTEIVRLRGQADARDQLARDQQLVINRLRSNEANLRAVTARNEEILESISDAFYAVDAEWRFTYVNRKAEEWWQRRREQLIGKVYWEEFPQAVGSAAYDAHMKASQERSVVRLETVSPILNHWVDISIYPTKDGGLSVYFRDIQGRKRTQEAQRASEEFNRGVLQASADCIKVLTLDARLEFMSEGGMCVMEVDDFGAIKGARWTDFWKGDKHAEAVAAIEAAKRGGVGRFAGHAPTMKGNPRWWDVIVSPINGADGMPEKLLSVSRDVTPTKLAEERLRGTEARYRQIVEGAEAFAIVTLDENGVVTGWNSGAERVLGYTSEEAIGQPSAVFFTPEDRAAGAPADELRQASETGRAVDERWHLRKDGSRFWGSGLTMPLAVDGGGYVKIFRDRTIEHEAEARLRDSEARLRFFGELDERLFRSANAVQAMEAATSALGQSLGVSRCAYADVDTDNNIFWIRSDYNAPGIESSAGRYSLDLFGPRATADMRAGRTLIVRDVTRELKPGEGREMFQAIGIDAIICCPLIKDGRLAAMMAVHQDVARDWTNSEIALVKEVVERCWAHVERVGAEARLRESEERLRLAVHNADVGFWDLDLVRNELIWPPQTKAMFGISADVRVTMEDFYRGLHPDDVEQTTAAFEAAADPEKRALYDVEYRTIGIEDGVVRWVAAKGRGSFDADGRCLRVAGTAVEISSRKQAEEALHELNATLESRIAEAVAEREEVQEALRQSQKMEAMGQLTGGVAHDFNNLLTPIVGSLDLLQRKKLGTEREQRLIDGAVKSAERARTLVQRLLAFARRQPLQAQPIDLSKLIHGMGDLIASTTGPQIRVAVEADVDLPPAEADPHQLEMAILNLAVNARDAMPDGGTLRISADAETIQSGHQSGLRSGDYIRLSVADTGEGMNEDVLARAIEPFFSTKGVGKGTGLGLSMVHGLASQLGGALTISSRPKLGTNIELWLPQSTAVPQITPAPKQTTPHNVSQTALLVDDDELVRISTADMLTDLGYRVVEASSGEEAMRLIQSESHFDLLVTDHLMPGMTGTELVYLIRSRRPAMPAVIVSGYAEYDGIDPSLPRLAKPFRKDELASILAQLETSEMQ